MNIPNGYSIIQRLTNIPPIDNLSYALVADSTGNPHADAYLVSTDTNETVNVLAYIDGSEGAVFRLDHFLDPKQPTPVASQEEPLVKIVGAVDDETGQVVIKQPEGHWRRYSRWDKIKKAPPSQPNAVVRTLPQCGCGGYLGAPMMFDSFKEMLSYFFVVFSDAEAVNAKHAAILVGDSCSDSCSI